MARFKSSPLAPMEADGTVKGYASTFDRDPDAYGDVIAPGAFAKSLERWAAIGKPIPLLYGHNTDDPEYNIGKITEAREDERGLYIEAEFDADNPKAQYVRKLAQEGRLYQFSFAYDVLDWSPVELEDGRKANELREIDLFEVSLVQIPANQHAEVTEVKSGLGGETFGYVVDGVFVAPDALADVLDAKSGRRLSKASVEAIDEAMEAAREAEEGARRALAILAELREDETEGQDEPAGGEPSAQAQSAEGQTERDGKAAILDLYKQSVIANIKE